MEQRTIGVAGAAAGMGVTHLVMALANYSVSHRRRKTAVVELSGNHTIEEMAGTSDPFDWNRISCYPNFTRNGIADVINRDYEVVIFDMGSSYYRIRTELLRCNRKLILGSLAPWRKMEYIRFAMEVMGDDRSVRNMAFLTQNGMKKDKKDFKKIVGQPVYPVPYLPEPLLTEKSQYEFFDRFIY